MSKKLSDFILLGLCGNVVSLASMGDIFVIHC